MEHLPEFVTVIFLHWLAVISPGPDFFMITRNSLIYSRRTGVFSAFGLALGILIHVTYSLIGIGFIISQSVVLFSVIKYLGAGYLIYIGYKSINSKAQILTDTEPGEDLSSKEVSRLAAVKMGFLTNVLNPKATLFFLALFTQVINQNTPQIIKIFYGLEMSVMTFVWFSLVAVLISHRQIKRLFVKVQRNLEKVFGIVLILFGIKVAFSKN